MRNWGVPVIINRNPEASAWTKTVQVNNFMKIVACLIACIGIRCAGQEIDLHSRPATFTNLEGRSFEGVALSKADLDGVIWRKDASGGRVCFTNLSPALLDLWGIPTNRIEIARSRAERRAMSASQARERALRQAQIEAVARAKSEADWEAGAASRESGAQMKSDLAKMQDLNARIMALQKQVDWANTFVPTMAGGDPSFVATAMEARRKVNVAQQQVNDAQVQLDQMAADYARKYK